jgi:hypothetical protein
MRISYDNLLKTSTLTASYENANYPVENIYHRWQRKTFKATDVSTHISAILDDVTTITSIGIDYHNLVTCRVILYDYADAVIEDIANIIEGNCSFIYGTWVDVARVAFICTSITTVEIGTIFIGQSLYFPIQANQDIPLRSSDVLSVSSDRQTSGRKGSVTRAGTITVPLLTSTQRKSIEEVFYEMGLIEPFFIDLWDDSHSDFEPIYGTFTSEISVTHLEEGDTISFSFEEAN